MKLKIALLVLLCFSVGIAQQKDKKQSTDKGKWEELKEYPKPISPIQPEYPQIAKLAGIEGKVYVETLISENGDVIDTKVMKSDHETLIGAAVAAIKTTKFSPGVSHENKKVRAWVVIPIAFKLDDLKSVGLNEKVDVSVEEDINAEQLVEVLPKLSKQELPEYPEEAKKGKITGKVFVKIFIDEVGKPKKAVIIKSDNYIFNNSTINAAMKSRFTPAMQDGKPVAVWIVLPYRFTLGGVKDKDERESFFVLMVGTNTPSYPKEAIEKKIEGQVFVKVFLDEISGKLEKTEIYKSDNEMLNKSAVGELTNRWDEFYTGIKKVMLDEKAKGKKIPSKAELTSGSIIRVHFKLEDLSKK